jgi:uncharacterized protein DUF4190
VTYPTSGGTPDPAQPQQPYGQPSDPTAAYQPAPTPPGYDPTTPYQQGPAIPYGPPPGAEPPFDAAPAYGPPAYQMQGGYGAPGYGPPMYPQMMAPTNTLAILALVFAFVFAPASIVLGHLAKKQIRQTGEQGEGLATAGLWLGYLFTGLGLLLCVGYFVIFAVAVGTTTTTGTTHI